MNGYSKTLKSANVTPLTLTVWDPSRYYLTVRHTQGLGHRDFHVMKPSIDKAFREEEEEEE